MKHTLNINKNYMNDDSEKLQLTKYCEWKGCNKKGIYRAPKNRENLREFRWFCLEHISCLLYTSPSPRDLSTSRMPSSA